MKKNLLFTLLLFVVSTLGVSSISAQTCVPDPQYNVPGIFPSDTLPDLAVGTPYSEVVHFLFPPDTMLLGQTLAFDSFVVSSVSNIPVNLNWECNLNHPTCSYPVTPGQLTRGCVKIFGTPTSGSSNYPAYDSAIVSGVGWVTIPFVGAQGVADDISVYYRVDPNVSITSNLEEQIGLEVKPNPITENSVVAYNLTAASDVSISIFNANGQRVHSIFTGQQAAGRHVLPVALNTELAEGVYFVRFELDGEFATTRKLISLR